MQRTIGTVAAIAGAAVALVAAIAAVRVFGQTDTLCPDDAMCDGARASVAIALFAVFVGLVTVFAGVMIRRRAE